MSFENIKQKNVELGDYLSRSLNALPYEIQSGICSYYIIYKIILLKKLGF